MSLPDYKKCKYNPSVTYGDSSLYTREPAATEYHVGAALAAVPFCAGIREWDDRKGSPYRRGFCGRSMIAPTGVCGSNGCTPHTGKGIQKSLLQIEITCDNIIIYEIGRKQSKTDRGDKVLIYLQMIEDEGDRSKFLRIYNTYRNMMYGIAVKILENEQDAEDAVHQAFLAIIEHLDDVKEEDVSRTKAFTAVITERKAIDIIRARAKFVDTHLEDAAGGIEVAYEGENDLARAMARMNPRYREALLLRYDSGYSTKEIARMMGLSRGTAQKLIWRAKEALRKELEKEGQDE